MDEFECQSGHMHKSSRSADRCDRRQSERAKSSRRVKMTLIDPSESEHGGAYFIPRGNKIAFGRRTKWLGA